MQKAMFPHDFSIQGKGTTGEQMDQVLTEFVNEQQLPVTKKGVYPYYTMGVTSRADNQLDINAAAQKICHTEKRIIFGYFRSGLSKYDRENS